MVKTVEQLSAELYDAMTDSMNRYMGDDARKLMSFSAPTVSPLEQVVGAGLWSWVCCYNFVAMLNGAKGTAFFHRRAGANYKEISASNDHVGVTVWHHVRVDQYTADFLVRVAGADKVCWVAVECDGHDFHERTKEQAEHDRKRDRHFQDVGLHVLRFTGSEIWRNPHDVLLQIYEFADKKVR